MCINNCEIFPREIHSLLIDTCAYPDVILICCFQRAQMLSLMWAWKVSISNSEIATPVTPPQMFVLLVCRTIYTLNLVIN